MSAQELEKLIKIEKGLFPFMSSLPEFLHGPTKTFGWEKFFEGEIKVFLDMVNMFFATKFHLEYAMVEREKVSFNTET